MYNYYTCKKPWHASDSWHLIEAAVDLISAIIRVNRKSLTYTFGMRSRETLNLLYAAHYYKSIPSIQLLLFEPVTRSLRDEEECILSISFRGNTIRISSCR